MEFYLSVSELLGKTANPLILIFVPIFLFTGHWLRRCSSCTGRERIHGRMRAYRSAWPSATSSPDRNAWCGLRDHCNVRLRDQADDYPDFVSALAEPNRAVPPGRSSAFYVEHRCSHRIGLLLGIDTACIIAARRCWSPPPSSILDAHPVGRFSVLSADCLDRL